MGQRHVTRPRHVAPADPPRIREGLVVRATWAGRDPRRAVAGEAGDAVDTRGLNRLGQGRPRHDGGEPSRQHRRTRPGWRYGQPACNRHDVTMVIAGAFGDLPWLEAQWGTASQGLPLIAQSWLNSRLAPAASPALRQRVGPQGSSSIHQAWCRLTCTRPRRPIPPASRVSTT